ncbi:hypothetical protein Dalk_1328 [Desulfatibacillum aliphaticivorans]|uniref:Non-reducing end beta-L-arabinofuranosidase-like GH127 catalytic domain-containing protein n=1 Tax=Desulfatibacillum aliphaticivorans TaxID=218208 RepID=B8F9T3_DESAL|nr:beta-L-arabinofuranosidase domain-containing protein [Desulfatibacillum aliphaticivorans]ACL03029.1 hypothetical protein Dalk_1328 [Desulfatibacillum aliphaticivorans]
MKVILQKLFSYLFIQIKKVLGRESQQRLIPVRINSTACFPAKIQSPDGCLSFINDIMLTGQVNLTQSDVYEFDNKVDPDAIEMLKKEGLVYHQPRRIETSEISRLEEPGSYPFLWEEFIQASAIAPPWRNAGFHYACYVLPDESWGAPSWIWTNAAIGRFTFNNGNHDQLLRLARNFIECQLATGGWVVRYDFKGRYGRLSQTVAPNDSAYICTNTLLPAYKVSKDEVFLNAACRCADWIMKEGHQGHLVHIGYEQENKCWDVSANIVDIGFTVALFVGLYKLTGEKRYKAFARSFIHVYLEKFYIGDGRFATAIDSEHNHRGTGFFTRGHAWALEGLIPYYDLTGDSNVADIIEDVVRFLIDIQNPNGSWLHLYRPGIFKLLSGDDSKGTPVIANALVRWSAYSGSLVNDIERAANRAVQWCVNQTATQGPGRGGIFSWSPEGAFAGKTRVAVACVYSNCYLLEMVKHSKILSKGKIDVKI